MAILATVMTVLDLLTKATPVLIQVGTNLKPFAESLYKQFKGGELTDAERTELEAAVDAQYEHFMRPQSPPQPGDPDYVKVDAATMKAANAAATLAAPAAAAVAAPAAAAIAAPPVVNQVVPPAVEKAVADAIAARKEVDKQGRT